MRLKCVRPLWRARDWQFQIVYGNSLLALATYLAVTCTWRARMRVLHFIAEENALGDALHTHFRSGFVRVQRALDRLRSRRNDWVAAGERTSVAECLAGGFLE